MKTLYGIEIKNSETGLWQPTDEELYGNRRTAAYRMIELNNRVPFSAVQRFRVIVIENAD
jgi:hypothetical protein